MGHRPLPLQACSITSMTTMYQYLHQRVHLCSEIKLILHKNRHKQLLTHTDTRNGKMCDGSYPATKVLYEYSYIGLLISYRQ